MRILSISSKLIASLARLFELIMTTADPDKQKDHHGDERPGQPLTVEDDRTHRMYVIVAKEEFARLVDDELRRELQIGLDEADREELTEWNPDRIKMEGRQRLRNE